MPTIKVFDSWFRLLIEEKKILERVHELGREIKKDLEGQCPIFIGVLNGSVLFMADLIRAFEDECEIDHIKLSSYGDRRISSGTVTIQKDPTANIKNRHVVIVEDIIDSGLSITFLREYLSKLNPASLRIATLLYKSETVNINFKVDYIGFEISKLFVVGYGLDYAQKGRNLRNLYILDDPSGSS